MIFLSLKCATGTNRLCVVLCSIVCSVKSLKVAWRSLPFLTMRLSPTAKTVSAFMGAYLRA